MLESLLSVRNVCWAGGAYQAAIAPAAIRERGDVPLQGRFACASQAPDGSVTLARDPLGLNKLFIAAHQSGTVVAANYLVDLVLHGVPFEAMYSVPAGHVVRIAPDENRVEVSRYAEDCDDSAATADVDAVARIPQLGQWLCVRRSIRRQTCPSACRGLDSGLIAALARRYFPAATAYTYSFTGRAYRSARTPCMPGGSQSFDLRLVPAMANDQLCSQNRALLRPGLARLQRALRDRERDRRVRDSQRRRGGGRTAAARADRRPGERVPRRL
jgi:asparagine synthetase B (glutamine-hydrolysing)